MDSLEAQSAATGATPTAEHEAGEPLQLRIVRVTREAESVISVELARHNGGLLPPWQPGAHVETLLPSGRVRHYSLCGDPDRLTSYRLAVLRESGGRGGSIEVHDIAHGGGTLHITPPRNRFPLHEAPRYLFLAGGIGVTPLLPMVAVAERRGRPWRLVYGGRSRASMAFIPELTDRRGGMLELLPQDEHGHPPVATLLSTLEPDTAIYACGPAAMLAAIETAAQRLGVCERLHVERFAAAAARETAANQAFDVVLRRSGRTVHVAAGRTLGSVLQDEGADVTFSCEEGCCGTCETRVLGGVPDHRDCVLTAEEKAKNDRMMVCVGRSLSPTLVLDA